MTDNIEKLEGACQLHRRVTCSTVRDSQADINHGQKVVGRRVAVLVSAGQKKTEHGYD